MPETQGTLAQDTDMLRAFPLMAIIVALYNGLIFFDGGLLSLEVVRVSLPSHAEWTLVMGDLLVTGALMTLFIELIAASGTGTSSVLNHGLSVLVLMACVVEFLLVPGCATPTFFLITLLTLVDVVAGFSIGITAARRDVLLSSQ